MSRFHVPVASRRFVRPAVYALVVMVAVGVAYFATREVGVAAPVQTGHVHVTGATGGGAGAGRPVMLSPEDERRIGVTYATAQLGPLAKEVRTVGQVTFDETRVQTISPKVEGWVDRLFVNATGQPVSVGQPLPPPSTPTLAPAAAPAATSPAIVAQPTAGTVQGRARGQPHN